MTLALVSQAGGGWELIWKRQGPSPPSAALAQTPSSFSHSPEASFAQVNTKSPPALQTREGEEGRVKAELQTAAEEAGCLCPGPRGPRPPVTAQGLGAGQGRGCPVP